VAIPEIFKRKSEVSLKPRAVEAGRPIDNSASFYRRRRFAELSQPHPTSQIH